MNSSRCCCQSILRSTSAASWRANGGRRAFSRAAPQQKDALPEYYESSSPELDNILNTINSKILFPKHLNHEQRLLVYKKKNIPRLTNEPLYAQIGSVDMQLEPLNVRKDIPNQWDMIKQAVNLSKEQDDWENLVKMLEGFHRAGIKIKTSRILKIIRCANEAGMQHIVFTALQQAQTTGVTLKIPEILDTVLQGMHTKASLTGWDVTSTKKALSLAEQVVELMEMPAHISSENFQQGDPRSSPFVISLPLELAATRAALHLDGKDVDGKVAKYALRLMAAFKQDGYLEKVLPKTLSDDLINEKEYKQLPNHKFIRKQRCFAVTHKIESWVPVWNALQKSTAVLGEDMPMREDAQNILKMVEERLTGAAAVVRKHLYGPEVENAPCLLRLKECGL